MALESIIIAIHVLAAIAITGLVLMQRGKGADIGASFGSGASQTMFGSLGSGNFLTKSTTLMAVVFFATSLGLAVIANQRAEQTVQDNSLISGDIEQVSNEARQQQAPAQQQQAPAQREGGDIPTVNQGDGGDVPSVDPAQSTGAEEE